MPTKAAPTPFGHTLSPGAKPRNIGEKHARRVLIAQMFNAYKYGATLEELGEQYGISGERVRQLLKKEGYEPMSLSERRLNGARLRSREVLAAYRGTGSVARCAEILEMRAEHVRVVLDEADPDKGLRRRYSGIDAPSMRWYDNYEILDAIRTAAKESGEPLSKNAYLRVASREGLPAELTILRAFGSWSEACREAGVRSHAARLPSQRVYSDADCVDALRACWEDVGRIPTLREYANWREGRGVPSALTITLRLGGQGCGWTAALNRAFPED